MGKIADTYKARDVEEIIDVILYRPWGYALAVGARRVGMNPNQISVIGMVVGIAAGHFFFYDRLDLNLLGIFLWMLAQAMDGADGQLARMTDNRSLLGRMLDGISDNVKFLSVYIHLGLRLAMDPTGGIDPIWAVVLVFASGLAHSYQSALADFYRNAYLFFVEGSGKAEFEDIGDLKAQYKAYSWRREPLMKFLWRGYTIYTVRQERWSRASVAMRMNAVGRFGAVMPDAVRDIYRKSNKKLLRYYNALTTNTRMVVLYASLMIGQVGWFFAFELVVLNLLMLTLWMWWQPAADRAVEQVIAATPPTGSN